MTIFTILFIAALAVWLIMTSGVKQPRAPYIANARDGEYARPLTNDERRGAWSAPYYGCGHHKSPANEKGSAQREETT